MSSAGIDLSKEIGIVQEYLHKHVREHYRQLHTILNYPALKDDKERTKVIADHLVACLPDTPERRLIAATIISLNSKDRYEAFNDYVDAVRNEHVLLSMGNGGSTSFALERPPGYRFNYENSKCIVKFDPNVRSRRYHNRDSGSESDGERMDDNRVRDNHRHENSYRPRGRGGYRGRGRGRGNYSNRPGSDRRNIVSSEQTTNADSRSDKRETVGREVVTSSGGIETDNKFDALVEHSKKVETKSEVKPVVDSAKQSKEELVKDGERRTKEMVKSSGKSWAEMADESADKESDDESEKPAKEVAKKN